MQFLLLAILLFTAAPSIQVDLLQSPEEYLARANELLASGDNNQEAIALYSEGLKRMMPPKGDSSPSSSLITELSLYTNLATALSSEGNDELATESYENALLAYKDKIGDIADDSVKHEANLIAAQASFYLGMVYQDANQPRDAIDAYAYAHLLDPLHWAAMANLGSVFHDHMADHAKALEAYNVAYAILTNADQVEPTDPPAEPRFILSQLQYRIGLCISHDADRKCAVVDIDAGDNTPSSSVSSPKYCNELAAHAFSLAVSYDPDNESAKHMLASITADATMQRASNAYVKQLFDEYATNFEHSLVKELGYNGYECLRRGFDQAFEGKPRPALFDLVVDAGCGTGLVGEQFRNVSKRLVGVDLSEAILQQARDLRPALYDETIAGDVTEVFRSRKPISLIVAGDSYIYFGDLGPLFVAMQEGLEVGGYSAFTLEDVAPETEEILSTSKPNWRWQLTASGRFAHRKDYVLAVGQAHDLHLQYYERMDGFRHERGKQVRGHLFIMRKGRPDQEL